MKRLGIALACAAFCATPLAANGGSSDHVFTLYRTSPAGEMRIHVATFDASGEAVRAISAACLVAVARRDHDDHPVAAAARHWMVRTCAPDQIQQKAIDAQHWLAYVYEQGDGVEQNGSKAVEWYRQAAEAGHPAAQNNLRLIFLSDKIVPRNLSRAFSLFQQAAEQRDHWGLNNLGRMYEMGWGTQQERRGRASSISRPPTSVIPMPARTSPGSRRPRSRRRSARPVTRSKGWMVKGKAQAMSRRMSCGDRPDALAEAARAVRRRAPRSAAAPA